MQSNLIPITYSEAMDLYIASNRRPFSFMAAPYRVPKTITVERGRVLASPPERSEMETPLTAQELERTAELLNELAWHLESAIESSVMPGARWPRDPQLRGIVGHDRRTLREVNRLIKKFRSLT